MNESRTEGDPPSQAPPPPIPEDADLRQFRHFAIDVHRLLTSETWVLATGDEAKAAMTLWLQAFHSTPAGSLPDNDRMLAYLSMAGPAWDSVRDHALRGWERHADGRLYHPVVTEKVLDALQRQGEFQRGRDEHREKMRQWRERQRSASINGAKTTGDDHVTITPPSRDASVTGKKEKMKEKEKNLHSPPDLHIPGLDVPPSPPPEAAGASVDPPEPKPAYTAEFESFWSVYPRRTGKLEAFRAFQRAKKLAHRDAIMAAAVLFAQACKGKEERFIPHPATWLNQGRWDDQPAATAAPTYVPMAANGG